MGFVDQGYTGGGAEYAVAVHGTDLQVMKWPEGQAGFMLLPWRWVVEHSFAWLSRFRRLGRDYERFSTSLQQLHFVFFACLMLARHGQSSQQALAVSEANPLNLYEAFNADKDNPLTTEQFHEALKLDRTLIIRSGMRMMQQVQVGEISTTR